MFVLVRLSPRSGNPEVWGFDEHVATCDIIYGSLVTGGLTQAVKPSGYGNTTYAKKRKDGYSVASANGTHDDIIAAKKAVNGSTAKLSKEAFAIYKTAMQLGNNPVLNLLEDFKPVADAPDANVNLVKATPVVFDSNAAWSW